MEGFLHTFVIVRTNTAGVHTGYLQALHGTLAILGPRPGKKHEHEKEVRRIWQWDGKGINTLNEVSLRGAGDKARLSEPVERIALTEAVEVLPCTEEAEKDLRNTRWHNG